PSGGGRSRGRRIYGIPPGRGDPRGRCGGGGDFWRRRRARPADDHARLLQSRPARDHSTWTAGGGRGRIVDRRTLTLSQPELAEEHLGFFRWGRIAGKVLITTDAGD